MVPSLGASWHSGQKNQGGDGADVDAGEASQHGVAAGDFYLVKPFEPIGSER